MRAAIVIAILLLAAPFARAHDEHSQSAMSPELRAWYMAQTDQQGRSCCSGQDGNAVGDPDWNYSAKDDVPYIVFIDGGWRDVHSSAVVREQNQGGTAWVWPYKDEGGVIKVRCFMPGTGG